MILRLFLIGSAILSCAPASAATISITVRDADGQPLRDAVVSIESAATRPGTPPAFSYPLRVEQKNIQFSPYVLLVPKGAQVSFPNRDRVRHQVYSFSKAKRFELKLYGQEDDRSILFDFPGTVALGCNIHDRMTGFIKVVDTPWAGQTDATGRTAIAGVPAGAATIRVWHPKAVVKGNEFAAALPIAGADVSRVITLRTR